jgi:hypothetical protein
MAFNYISNLEISSNIFQTTTAFEKFYDFADNPAFDAPSSSHTAFDAKLIDRDYTINHHLTVLQEIVEKKIIAGKRKVLIEIAQKELVLPIYSKLLEMDIDDNIIAEALIYAIGMYEPLTEEVVKYSVEKLEKIFADKTSFSPLTRLCLEMIARRFSLMFWYHKQLVSNKNDWEIAEELICFITVRLTPNIAGPTIDIKDFWKDNQYPSRIIRVCRRKKYRFNPIYQDLVLQYLG